MNTSENAIGVGFRFGVIHDAATECNHIPVFIHDRKHDTVPEQVIYISLFTDLKQAGTDQVTVFVSTFQGIVQAAECIRSKSKSILRHLFFRNFAFFQVLVSDISAGCQLLIVKKCCISIHS